MQKKKQISIARFRKKLEKLNKVFLSVAMSDFSVELDIPDREDEFTELYCGVKLMLDSTKEKIEELSKLNNQLFELTNKKTLALNEVESLARIGSWEWDILDDVFYCSDEFYRVYEITHLKNNTIDYITWLSFVHNEDKTFVNLVIQDAIINKTSWNLFHRILTANGQLKYIHGIGKMDVDKNGMVIRMYATVQDVTEIKISEEELRRAKNELELRVVERTRQLEEAFTNLRYETEENKKTQSKHNQLAAIVESSSEAIIGKTTDGYITSWNKGAQRIFGYTDAEAIGKHISIIIPENLAKEMEQVLAKLKVTGRVEPFETVRIRKDKSPVYLKISFSQIKSFDGELIGYSSFGVDITEEVRIRKSLEASEMKFKTLVETMIEGVVLTDKSNVIRFVNQAFLDQSGYEMEDLLDKPVGDLLSPLIYKSKKGKISLIKKSNIKSHYETEIKKKNGEKMWVLISRSVISSKENEIQGYFNLITDIDLRKKAEKERDAIASFSLENPNPSLRFSIIQDEFVFHNTASKHLFKFIHGKSNGKIYSKIIERIKQVNEKGKIVKEEMKISNQTYLFTFVPVKEGRYVNLYGSDITAVKLAEAEIKRLLFVLSQTDNAVIIADADGKIEWVNEGFERMTGYTLKDVKGTHGEKLRKGKQTGINPENLYYQKMVSRKKSVSYESKNYRKNGSEYWSFTTITPVLDKHGKIEGIVAIDADISLKKRAEHQMVLAMQMSEESSRAKQSFLANMSHEIRTPMNVIMGIIQLLRDTPLNDTQKEYLNSMDFASENLLSIVNDVLDISKVESGKMTLEKLEFDLRNLINELINSVGYRAKEKLLPIYVNIESTVPAFLVGDPIRLNQILLNLFSNSIKFTQMGEIRLNISLEKKENNIAYIKFVISDTGIGIPVEKQKAIFEEFVQAHSGNKRKFGGTGLGLSIVKKLVEIHHGEINLVSTPGKGSIFTVLIPYEIVDKEKLKTVVKENIGRDAAVLKGKNVLLVEDNKLNQIVAEKFLSSMGMSVVLAGNGKEAVESLRDHHFDAILMDIQMPEMDGYEATHFIRKSMKFPKKNTLIIAMTAHALVGEEKKCIDAGMDDYITKPLRREALEQVLTNLLKKHETRNPKNKIIS
ncbi:MAG: PAS domain S-box protein [Bacteroidota bacterium]